MKKLIYSLLRELQNSGWPLFGAFADLWRLMQIPYS